MKLQAAILDWAGTVIDHGSRAPMGAFVRAFGQFGVSISIDDARGPMGMAKWDHTSAQRPIKCYWPLYSELAKRAACAAYWAVASGGNEDRRRSFYPSEDSVGYMVASNSDRGGSAWRRMS